MAVKFRDYYQTLGVPKTASEDDIRKAFRKLARKYHPDVAKGNKAGAEEKFKEINEAYEVLGDPEKRRKYDQLGHDWARYDQAGGAGGFPGGAGGGYRTYRQGRDGRSFEFDFGGSTGFSDFFEQFFGGGFERSGGYGGYGSAGMERPAKGNVEADFMITLEEALHGGRRTINLRRADANGQTSTETYEVKIPAGVHAGQRIRLKGRGQNGGDLHLIVRYAKHPDFIVDPNGDVTHTLSVEAWQAVLGCEISVPTLDGAKVKLKIPAGSQPGQKFRLRDRGMPGISATAKGTRGDLYVRLEIRLPKTLTETEKELWTQLAIKSKRSESSEEE